MGIRSVVLMAIAVTLAGCAGPEAPDSLGNAGPTAGAPTNPAGPDGQRPPALPEPVTETINHDGDAGQGVAVCETQVSKNCTVRETKPYTGQFTVKVNGTILGGNLTLSWTAASPLYQELGFGAMTMTPGCRTGCHRHSFFDVTGTSPLTRTFGPADFMLEPGEVLHVYIYALTYREAGPVGAEVDLGQPAHVSGDASYRPFDLP